MKARLWQTPVVCCRRTPAYVTRRRATIATNHQPGRRVFFDEGTRCARTRYSTTLDDSDVKRAWHRREADGLARGQPYPDYVGTVENSRPDCAAPKSFKRSRGADQQALDTATTAVDSLDAKINLAKSQVPQC